MVCLNVAEPCRFGVRLRRLEQCSNLTKLAVTWEFLDVAEAIVGKLFTKASFHQLLNQHNVQFNGRGLRVRRARSIFGHLKNV